jgi:hypothetical protein
MKQLRCAAATLAIMALAAAPSAWGTANSHAGQHGNHCGLNHAKHAKGSGGSKVGQSCQKASHGGGSGDDTGDDTGGDA